MDRTKDGLENKPERNLRIYDVTHDTRPGFTEEQNLLWKTRQDFARKESIPGDKERIKTRTISCEPINNRFSGLANRPRLFQPPGVFCGISQLFHYLPGIKPDGLPQSPYAGRRIRKLDGKTKLLQGAEGGVFQIQYHLPVEYLGVI